MLPRPPSRRRSAGLRHRGLGLGCVYLLLERRALQLGHQAERLSRRQVALARLLGGVGGDGQALVTLDRAGVGGGLDLPGAGLVGVVAQGGVRPRSEDRQIRVGALDELEVVLPGLCRPRQLLLAAGGEPAGGGVVVARLPGGGPARLPSAARDRGTPLVPSGDDRGYEGQRALSGGSWNWVSMSASSAAACRALRRSANLSKTILARKRITSGSISSPVVTGSTPGIAAAITAMITVA